MVKITTSRARLDAALADARRTILLIRGSNGLALAVHDLADDKVTQPWRATFLVTDPSVLTAGERRDWLPDDGRYCVLGGDEPKRVAVGGSCDDLLRTDGAPSILAIRSAFARGDLL